VTSLSHSILKKAHRLISLRVTKKLSLRIPDIFVSAPFSLYPFFDFPRDFPRRLSSCVIKSQLRLFSVKPSDLSARIYQEKHDRDCDIQVITRIVRYSIMIINSCFPRYIHAIYLK